MPQCDNIMYIVVSDSWLSMRQSPSWAYSDRENKIVFVETSLILNAQNKAICYSE